MISLFHHYERQRKQIVANNDGGAQLEYHWRERIEKKIDVDDAIYEVIKSEGKNREKWTFSIGKVHVEENTQEYGRMEDQIVFSHLKRSDILELIDCIDGLKGFAMQKEMERWDAQIVLADLSNIDELRDEVLETSDAWGIEVRYNVEEDIWDFEHRLCYDRFLLKKWKEQVVDPLKDYGFEYYGRMLFANFDKRYRNRRELKEIISKLNELDKVGIVCFCVFKLSDYDLMDSISDYEKELKEMKKWDIILWGAD